MSSKYSHILGEKCPVCGSDLICEVEDKGAADFYLNYIHRCTKPGCQYKEGPKEQVSLSGNPNPSAFLCPMCNHDYSAHYISM